MILAAIVPLVLTFLIWVALAVMSFWIWKSSKAQASLMTMIGAALLALADFFYGLLIADLFVLSIFGAALVVLGYYYTVKPTVDARIRELKARASAASGSGTPPPAAPPAPPAT